MMSRIKQGKTMSKTKNIIFVMILIFGSTGLYAASAEANISIDKSKSSEKADMQANKVDKVSLDELVARYHKASKDDMYKIMNQIKQKIALMSQNRQEKAIKRVHKEVKAKGAFFAKERKRFRKNRKKDIKKGAATAEKYAKNTRQNIKKTAKKAHKIHETIHKFSSKISKQAHKHMQNRYNHSVKHVNRAADFIKSSNHSHSHHRNPLDVMSGSGSYTSGFTAKSGSDSSKSTSNGSSSSGTGSTDTGGGIGGFGGEFGGGFGGSGGMGGF